jgi:hypothetical protein
LIHIHRGKGGKDRYVPLPDSTLALLRQYWKTHGNPVWIFPASGRGGIHRSTAQRPTPLSNVQDAFRWALRQSGILKLHHGQVTFRCQDGHSKTPKVITLPAEEFICRFLQHVLPHRFQKLRTFGFFRSQQPQQFQQLKAWLCAKPALDNPLPELGPDQHTLQDSEPRPQTLSVPAVEAPCSWLNSCRARNPSPAHRHPSAHPEAARTTESEMKNTALTTVPQTNPGQLGRALSWQRSETFDHGAPPNLIPAEPFRQGQKSYLTPPAYRTQPLHSLAFTATTTYKPQITKPGSFNPELCGGFRVTSTLAQ